MYIHFLKFLEKPMIDEHSKIFPKYHLHLCIRIRIYINICLYVEIVLEM